MEKRNFFKSVSYLVITLVAVVFGMSLASCEHDPYDRAVLETTSVERIAKPVVIPGLDFNFRYDVLNRTYTLETPWTLTETETGFNDKGSSEAWTSHENDRYAVPESLREVSLQYTQDHTFASTVYTKLVSSSASRREYQDSLRYTAGFEDGQLAYLDIRVTRVEASVRDTMRVLPYIKVKNAKVIRIETLPGTTQTRGTYVSDSIVRRITWQLDCEVEKGDILSENIPFTQELQDLWKVLILSDDDVVRGYTKDKERIVIDDLTERCSFTEVLVMKSGEEHSSRKNIILNRLLKGIDEYSKMVSSFEYHWLKDNGVVLGSVAKGVRTEGNWTVDSRTDSFSADITNNAEPIVTSYTFKHEGATYKDEWVSEEFPLITPTMAEKATRVESIVSDNADYDMARLFNDINTSYLGYAQSCGETVKLMKRAVTIKWEGWESLDGKRIVYNDSTVHIPTYRIEYTDGNIVRITDSMMDYRELENILNWISIEANASQTTGGITTTGVTYRDMSLTTKKGFVFTWKRKSGYLDNTAQLAGSTQQNRRRFMEPVEVTVTYRGKSVTYPDLSLNTSHVANVTGGAVSGGYHVYNYTDDLTYRYGDNTKHVTSPGTIKVPEEVVVEKRLMNGQKIITDSLVKYLVDRVELKNGQEVSRKTVTCMVMRLLNANPGFNVIEANSSQNTLSAVATITGTAAQSKTVDGVKFSWNDVSRSINSKVKLAGSTQENSWVAKDPFDCVATWEGQTYPFSNDNVTVSNVGTLGNGSKSGDYMVYRHTNKLSYNYGSNTKYSTVNNTIKVKQAEPTFFPEEWGKLIEVKQTNANTISHVGSVYTWSLRFEKNGVYRVLPVVVQPGSTEPDWHFEYVEVTNETAYNGGVYQSSTGTWVNSIAKDEPSRMIWMRQGTERANKNYTKAQNENWDEGRLINGKPSVKTSRYSFTIANGKLTVKDTYTNKTMGTKAWTYYTGN